VSSSRPSSELTLVHPKNLGLSPEIAGCFSWDLWRISFFELKSLVASRYSGSFVSRKGRAGCSLRCVEVCH
jgi:hypothetical protein